MTDREQLLAVENALRSQLLPGLLRLDTALGKRSRVSSKLVDVLDRIRSFVEHSDGQNDIGIRVAKPAREKSAPARVAAKRAFFHYDPKAWGDARMSQKGRRLRSVPCPSCGAPAGTGCQNGTGTRSSVYHRPRYCAAGLDP